MKEQFRIIVFNCVQFHHIKNVIIEMEISKRNQYLESPPGNLHFVRFDYIDVTNIGGGYDYNQHNLAIVILVKSFLIAQKHSSTTYRENYRIKFILKIIFCRINDGSQTLLPNIFANTYNLYFYSQNLNFLSKLPRTSVRYITSILPCLHFKFNFNMVHGWISCSFCMSSLKWRF